MTIKPNAVFGVGSLFLAALYLLSVPASAAEPVAADTKDPATDYFPAVKQELARLQTTARCNDITASCSLETRLSPEAPPKEVIVRYSRATDTVYTFIDKFIVFARGEAPSQAFLLKLLALNAELVTAKFEWQAASNAVRLSTVQSCDSNFDRRAFRSQFTGLLKVAEKLHAELETKVDLPSPAEPTKADQSNTPEAASSGVNGSPR